jgi:mannitol/fructose-specific phosphotransferase system IIA component (Ntr-type)
VPATGDGVRAADVIASGGVLLQPACGSFEEAVRGLVDVLIANQCMPPDLRDGATRAVVERERMQSTAIVEIGVAVPHARVEGVDGVVAAMAVSPTAVYYAMAGVPISIVVVVLSAPELVGDHLDTLAGVSLLLQSADTRRGLEHAADSGSALRVLRGGNGRR